MKKFRKWATTLSLALILVLGGIGLAACNDPGEGGGTTTTPQYVYKVGDYTIDFGGLKDGEGEKGKDDVAASTWVQKNVADYAKYGEYDAVFELKGEVEHRPDVATAWGYGDDREWFILIRVTKNDGSNKTPHDFAETPDDYSDDSGFYNYITNYRGAKGLESGQTGDVRTMTDDNTRVLGTEGGTRDNTYFLVQGIKEGHWTMSCRISFTGEEGDEINVLFVIDPANYTLESPTEVTE